MAGARSRGGEAIIAALLESGALVVGMQESPHAVVDQASRTPNDAASLVSTLPRTVRTWVFASSPMVYGLYRDSPYDENDTPAPVELVGEGKAQAEEVGAAWTRAVPERTFVALRLGLLEDPKAPPLTPLGADPDLAARLMRGEAVPVPREELDVRRLQPWSAASHGQLVARILADPSPPAVLNAAAERPLSWSELMALRARKLGAPPPNLERLSEAELQERTPASAAPFLSGLRSPPVMDVGLLRRLYPD